MTRDHRLLGIVSHGVVLLWLAGGLGWWAVQATGVSDLRQPEAIVARIQPRPEPPPVDDSEAEPEPEKPDPSPRVEAAAPEPPPRAEPELEPKPERVPEPELAPSESEPEIEPVMAASAEPTRVRRADVFAGAALLDGAGAFPVLNCSYEDFDSFVDYARAMTDLGARFVVVRNRQILGGIDVESGFITEADLAAAFSPRARDYTGEPALSRHALAIRGRFGRGAVVMMLVPRDLDAGLFGGIARALSKRGERHQDYREIRGRYRRAAGGGVQLQIDSAMRPDGSRVDLGLLFDLNAVARVASSPRSRS